MTLDFCKFKRTVDTCLGIRYLDDRYIDPYLGTILHNSIPRINLIQNYSSVHRSVNSYIAKYFKWNLNYKHIDIIKRIFPICALAYDKEAERVFRPSKPKPEIEYHI